MKKSTPISKNSRRYSFLALDRLKEIEARYPKVPEVKKLTDEQIAWIEAQISKFSQCVTDTGYKKFSFLKKTKETRNAIDHSRGEETPKELQKRFNDFFSIIDIAKTELETNIKRTDSANEVVRKIEKSGSNSLGDEIAQKRITESLSDALDNNIPQNEKVPFDKIDKIDKIDASCEVQKFLETQNDQDASLLSYAKTKPELCEQIKTEILTCVAKAFDETDISNPKNPFFEENSVIQNAKKTDSKTFMATLPDTENALHTTKTGIENSASFDFYKNEMQKLYDEAKVIDEKKFDNDKKLHDEAKAANEKKLDNELDNDKKLSDEVKDAGNKDFGNGKKLKDKKLKQKIAQQTKVLSRNLKNDLQNSLTERHIAWQLLEIDKKRKAFLDKLYEKIEKFLKLEKSLLPLIKNFGRLWDLSEEFFNDSGFEVLEEFAALLEKDEGLKELVTLIGRQTAEAETYEKELRDKVVVSSEFHPEPAYRGQISGLRLSGEISCALPSELALSSNKLTRLYFAKKFAEKQLLSYKYENLVRLEKINHEKEEVNVAIADKKGPAIICVDTSGSMAGTPENVAKTLTFAIANKCLGENRKCYLISFSTKIETFDFSQKGGLEALVQFLQMSFHGGTDAGPALAHTLNLLEKNDWRNADVIVASDFIMENLSTELTEKIEAQRKCKTKFFSLVIGETGNENTIKCFDENWAYDTAATGEMRKITRQIMDSKAFAST